MQPHHILIVEDEPLIRMFAADILGDCGFVVSEAETAADALARLNGATGISAVVIDIGLPDQSGDALAREVRRHWPALPIVIASGRGAQDLSHALARETNLVFVGKPYTEDMLIDALAGLGVTGTPPQG